MSSVGLLCTPVRARARARAFGSFLPLASPPSLALSPPPPRSCWRLCVASLRILPLRTRLCALVARRGRLVPRTRLARPLARLGPGLEQGLWRPLARPARALRRPRRVLAFRRRLRRLALRRVRLRLRPFRRRRRGTWARSAGGLGVWWARAVGEGARGPGMAGVRGRRRRRMVGSRRVRIAAGRLRRLATGRLPRRLRRPGSGGRWTGLVASRVWWSRRASTW